MRTTQTESTTAATQRGTARRDLRTEADLEPCCLLVMEIGSRWPAWLEAPPAGRVLAQDADEPPTEFASRVVRAIRAIRTQKQSVATVVIAAGWQGDGEQSLFARSLVTQAAARAMDGGPGTVVLTGHDRLPDAARHDLMATAGVLASQLVGTAIDVRVRFETARVGPRATRADSGVYEPPPPAPSPEQSSPASGTRRRASRRGRTPKPRVEVA